MRRAFTPSCSHAYGDAERARPRGGERACRRPRAVPSRLGAVLILVLAVLALSLAVLALLLAVVGLRRQGR
ncbi:hypothetical protein, partial [Nocardioides sp.]|uniref:hypothetical protein n=1 Tax=Nocardioides sp. TaxID=35761 RepID=UPI003569E165